MRETHIRVRSVEGRKLPIANDPKNHIDGVRTVPNTGYYRRAIARGDIEIAVEFPSVVSSKEKES